MDRCEADRCESQVRIGHTRSEAEKQIISQRITEVYNCLWKHGIHVPENELPNIAVLGSGGGMRAMVALLGSLWQMHEEELLNSVMYLSGVSGSTWCMASLYKEPEWANNLATVKEGIVERLLNGKVTYKEQYDKLMKYIEKDNFSMTDICAVIFSGVVKEIDEHVISDMRHDMEKRNKDPYPIFTVIDQKCKCDDLNQDIWFEITPDESGYSLTGAFVDSSAFESEFSKGSKIKSCPEADMLYLQGLCGSALAELPEIVKLIWENIKSWICPSVDEIRHNSTDPEVELVCQVLSLLVDLNIAALEGKEVSFHITKIKELTRGKNLPETVLQSEIWIREDNLTPEAVKEFSLHLFSWVTDVYHKWNIGNAIIKILKVLLSWTWGTTHNILHKMTGMKLLTIDCYMNNVSSQLYSLQRWSDHLQTIVEQIEFVMHPRDMKGIDPSLLKTETRYYEDAGLLLNSPYFSVLRKERETDLIISLDFSGGDPFMTLKIAAKMCKDLEIPFPDIVIDPSPEPQDFYVFRKDNAPTVIHIPLFNGVNCPGEVKDYKIRYNTLRLEYTSDMISDLLEKSGLNIKNNKEKLLNEIRRSIENKKQADNSKV